MSEQGIELLHHGAVLGVTGSCHELRANGSGMCAGGRVVNYLKALLNDPRNDVLFVGYQAEGTPGRDILDHGPKGGWVELDGKRFTILERVYQVSGYSAHAGQEDLINFATGIIPPPEQLRLIHGEANAKAALQT